MRAFAIAALLLLVAGCITPGLQPAATTGPVDTLTGSVKTVLERLSMKTKDGAAAIDIVANMSEADKASGAKLPVIVDIGPYYSTGILKYSAIDMRMADYFVPRGYVMARAALRGTGESSGCFDLGGKTEQQDVHDIVEFLGTQPWSNGNVAVFGKSYDGTTPWEAAITQPSHLKTIVPISGITDMYRYTMYDGTVYPEEVAFEPYYYLFVGDDISVPGPDGGSPAWSGNPQTLMASLNPCEPTAFAEQTRGDMLSTVTGDHGDPFWLERDYELQWSKIQVPVFLVHGMQDWNVKPDHEVPLFNDITTPKAAWFGQWEHNYPDVNTLKPEWSRHDWNETLLTWFDHWLKGMDNDWQKVAHVEAQDQAGTWTNYTAWPPASATEIVAYPGQGLTSTPNSVEFSFSDPLQQGFVPGASPVGPFATGASFVTAPMTANVTLLGRAFADVTLSIDRPGANLGIALYDVGPDGKWVEVDHGMRELRHAKSREASEPVTPNQVFNTTVWFYPEQIVLAKGHSLGFSVSAELPKWIEPSPFAGALYHVMLGANKTRLHVFAADEASATTLRMALGGAGGASQKSADPTLEILK